MCFQKLIKQVRTLFECACIASCNEYACTVQSNEGRLKVVERLSGICADCISEF